MDKNNSYQNTEFGFDAYNNIEDSMFNPMAQYEQAYVYYRYLCTQLDYKIKCKEYEKLCKNDNRRVE